MIWFIIDFKFLMWRRVVSLNYFKGNRNRGTGNQNIDSVGFCIFRWISFRASQNAICDESMVRNLVLSKARRYTGIMNLSTRIVKFLAVVFFKVSSCLPQSFQTKY